LIALFSAGQAEGVVAHGCTDLEALAPAEVAIASPTA